MTCDRCGISDADGNPYVFKNLGDKKRYASGNTRRYECTSCGHRFVTMESYHRHVIRQPSDALQLGTLEQLPTPAKGNP